MSYPEPKDPETGKAPKHQASALKASGNISNAEIVPSKEPLHGFSVKEMEEIEDAAEAKLLDDEPYDEMRGKVYQFDDDSEWIIFESSEAAERQAVDYVQSMIEDEPESFTQEWLRNFIYMTDTDRRVLADEEATDFAYEQLDEDDVMKETGFDEKFDELQEGIDSLESEIEDLQEEKTELESNEDEYPKGRELNAQISDIEDNITNKETEMDSLTSEQEALPDKAREKVQEDKYDEIYEELDDPVQYFVEDHGMYSIEDLMKASFISIEERDAATDAVESDGVAHFLASYDEEEVELDNGMVMFRTN